MIVGTELTELNDMKGRCPACEAEWQSLALAHCRGCCHTFSTDRNFDLHRRNFKCVNPAKLVNKNTKEPYLVYNAALKWWQGPFQDATSGAGGARSWPSRVKGEE